ncbi:MAG: DUF5615 family PIN-like protein [Chloroflexota bacterium]
MSLKLYTDGHIAKSIVRQLRLKDVDIERCEDVGLKDASDLQHFEYALENERTIVTQDADFLRIHNEIQREGKNHFGIIRITSENITNVGKIVNELEFLHNAIDGGAATLEEDVYNQVRYI